MTDTHTDTRVDAPADVARDTGHDTGVDVVHDTGRDTGTRICPPSCTTDNDCVSTCPSAPSGQVWCCEFNTCTSLAMCPAGTDGGTGSDAFGFDVPSLDGFFGDGGCFGTPCTTDADCVAACGAGATCFGGFCF